MAMERDDRSSDAVNAGAITAPDIERLCNRIARETAHTGSSPDRVVARLAAEHLRPDLHHQREEQEDRHEDAIGLAGRDVLSVLLREQARERERLEYALSLQVRDLASRIEDVYWSRSLEERADALHKLPEAADKLQERHRDEEAALARLHDKDLEWLHGDKTVRTMLTWIARLSPRAVDAALAGLRQLHQRELDVLKTRHEHDIRVTALGLEHEEDRAAALTPALGKPARDPAPEKGGRGNHSPQPRRTRKPDLGLDR